MSHRTNPGCCFGHVYSGCRLWGPVLTNQCNGRGVHLFMSVSLFVCLFLCFFVCLFVCLCCDGQPQLTVYHVAIVS